MAISSPDFCIESLNYNQRLLLLYNAAPGDVQVTLEPEHGGATEDPILLKQNKMAPVNLIANRYTLIAKRSPQPSGDRDRNAPVVKTITFDGGPARVEILFSSDPLDDAEGQELAGEYLQSREMLPDAAQRFRAASRAIIQRETTRVDAEIARSASDEANLTNALRASGVDTQAKRDVAERGNRDLASASERLNQCRTSIFNIGGCSSVLSDMGNLQAAARQSAAVYAESERRLELQQRMLADMLVEKQRVAQESFRVNRVRQAAEAYDASALRSRMVEGRLSTELKPLFGSFGSPIAGL